MSKITEEQIDALERATKRSVPTNDGQRLVGFVLPSEIAGLSDGLFMLEALISAARLGIAAGAADVGAIARAIADGFSNGNEQFDEASEPQRQRFIAAARSVAALSQPPAPAEGWRPIETAPKDGRPVLLWWSTRGASVGRYEHDDMFSERPSSWVSPEFGWRSDGDLCIPVNQEHCTHWMPLPAAPEARS